MIVVIRFLVWCVHFIAVTMPGYSRDGPPCTLQMFAGVKYKPDWSTVKMARRADVWNLFAVDQKNKRAAVVRLYPSWQAGETEMSEPMTVEQKMARSIETWRKCDPILMASQSQAALIFAFRDMKRDILVLADEVAQMRIAAMRAEQENSLLIAALKKEQDSVDGLNGRIVRIEKERDELRRRVDDSALEFAQFLFAKGVIPYSKFDSLIAEFEANKIEGGE